MNAAPKLKRERLAKSDQPPAAKMGVIQTSNAAPKFPLSSRTFWLIRPQLAGAARRLPCLENLQGESLASNSAIQVRVCFAAFVAFGPHPVSPHSIAKL
jgi:hypothetical protein